MLLGFFYGFAACVLWGSIYLVPLVLPGYESSMMATARYISIVLIAAPLIWIDRKEFRQYRFRDWVDAARLGIVGNIVYFWFLATSIQWAGAPWASMCMSFIPVLVAIVANHRVKDARQKLPWIKIVPGLSLLIIGMGLANSQELRAFTWQDGDSEYLLGLLFGVIALLVWTWYPIRNADWLLANPKRSVRAWSTAQQLLTAPVAMVVYVALWMKEPARPFLGETPLWFIVVMIFSGIVCAWFGLFLWSKMSQRLPTALAGQMIVFETVFAVIYAHIWDQTWPDWTRIVGVILLVLGVLVSMRSFRGVEVSAND